MMGKAWILEGDKASCGAKFIANQGIGFVGGGSPTSSSSSINGFVGDNCKQEVHDEQIQFIFEGESEEIISLINYRLKVGGKVYEGKLDSEGKTPRFVTDRPEKITDILRISHENKINYKNYYVFDKHYQCDSEWMYYIPK